MPALSSRESVPCRRCCRPCSSPRRTFFFSSRRRHTRCLNDWSSDVCSSDLIADLDSNQIDNLSRSVFVNLIAVEVGDYDTMHRSRGVSKGVPFDVEHQAQSTCFVAGGNNVTAGQPGEVGHGTYERGTPDDAHSAPPLIFTIA